MKSDIEIPGRKLRRNLWRNPESESLAEYIQRELLVEYQDKISRRISTRKSSSNSQKEINEKQTERIPSEILDDFLNGYPEETLRRNSRKSLQEELLELLLQAAGIPKINTWRSPQMQLMEQSPNGTPGRNP